MDEAETKVWITLTLYGGVALVVLGTGLSALVERSYVLGGVFTVAGVGGVVDAGRRAVGHKLVIPNSILLVALAATWVFLGYDIYDRGYRHNTQSFRDLEYAWHKYDYNEVWNRTFENTKVEMDGNFYGNCTFKNVTFLYNGTAPTELQNPKYAGSITYTSFYAPVKNAWIISSSVERSLGLPKMTVEPFPSPEPK